MEKKTKKDLKSVKKQVEATIPKKGKMNLYLMSIFCFFFAFVLYANTLKHSYALDDWDALANNRIVQQGIKGIPTILSSTYRFGVNKLTDNLYRPFSQIMFAIEWQLSPCNPHLNHFINVLFYAISGLLLFIVLRKYLNFYHPIIPFLITLLFIAHPIHTEVVANIKSRDEIMSFFFLILTLYFMYSWFIKESIFHILLSIFFFYLAIISKEGVVTMLFIIPIMGWYFTKSKPKNLIISFSLLLIPAITYILIRNQIIHKISISSEIPFVDNFLVGIKSSSSHFATAVMILGKYLVLLFFPVQLVCDYSYNQIQVVGFKDVEFIFSFCIYLFLFSIVVFKFNKKNPLILGIIIFLVSLSIYSNIFFHIGSSFAERFLFLPSFGFCIAIVFLFIKVIKLANIEVRVGNVYKSNPIFISIFIFILILLSIKTITRASEWENENILFSKDIIKSPKSVSLHLFYGITLNHNADKENDNQIKQNYLFKAIEQFNDGVKIYPASLECYNNIGLNFQQLGKNDSALINFNNALKINSNNAEVWGNTGNVYSSLGEFEKSIKCYENAIRIDSNYALAYINIGSSLGSIGKYYEAIYYFKKHIYLKPNNYKAYRFIGITYELLKQNKEAEYWFEKANYFESISNNIKKDFNDEFEIKRN